MSRYLRPVTPLILAVLFLASGWVGGPNNAVDVAIVDASAGVRQAHPALEMLAARLTFLGSGYMTFGLALGGAICLSLRRRNREAALLLLGLVGERFAMDGLKLLYARPRPPFDLHPAAIDSFSFPSGHTSNSMTAYVLFALLAVPEQWRRAALAIAIPLTVAIGFTRPFLGVHWPSDVVGGWCLAGVAIWTVMTIERRFSPGPA